MTLVLGLDFETTGLDPQTDRIIEVGAVLWDVEAAKPVRIFSTLIKLDDGGFGIPSDIQRLTGITPSLLTGGLMIQETALEELDLLCSFASFLVAHNAEFEKGFLRSAGWLRVSPWIDTACDLPLPEHIRGRSLESLCYAHRILNPFPHRALFDTLAMLQVMSHYDFDAIRERAAMPTVRLVARVSFEDKDKAKAIGYRWDGAAREWWKPVKSGDAAQEGAKALEAGFEAFIKEEPRPSEPAILSEAG